jgi:hypothetical protein
LLLGSKNEPYPAHPYQQAMLDYAHANNVPLINIIDLMKSQDQNAVFMDHVHPTVKGHAMIAQQLAPVVRGLDSYAAACRAASNGGSSVTSLTAKPANRQQ